MKNFLLVDDDDIFNFISKTTLEKMHLVKDLHTAQSGKEAIDLFNDGYEEHPDVILLDINMPVMDGFEFLEAFGKLNFPGRKNVKIIVVTSSLDPTDIVKVKQLGASACLSKPLHPDTLLAALQN